MTRVRLAGILNVTPDSFSDGGAFTRVDAAVERGLELVEQGADWVDVGGESTRPGAAAVSERDELDRVVPVVRALAKRGVAVSIDTQKAGVARACLAEGAQVVNDVGGFLDPEMVSAVAQAGAGAVVMHMRGDPRTMQSDTDYADLIEVVSGFLAERIQVLRSAGVREIWADPGIGFGKSAQGCVELLSGLGRFRALGVPLYVGASRKSFLAHVTGVEDPQQRLGGSLGAAAVAALNGAAVLRVHDVAHTRQLLRVLEACR